MRGCFESLVGNHQVMVLFVSPADTLEDIDGFILGGFFHQHGLEAALERGIRFDVFAVFIQRGGANHLQFATRERGLEDIGRVHGGASRASAHQHVDFVDEQDCAGLLELVDDAFEALFELAAVHGAGHERANVQLQQALVHKGSRHIAVDDALGESLDDGSLADAGFADQRGIVLRPARQDLNDAFDLGLTPDNGVEFFFFSVSGQVGCQLVHQRGFLPGTLLFFGLTLTAGCRGGGGRAAFIEHAARLAADLVGGDAQLAQHIHGRAFAAHQPQQDVFSTNIVMTETTGLFNGLLEDALRFGRKLDLATGIIA